MRNLNLEMGNFFHRQKTPDLVNRYIDHYFQRLSHQKLIQSEHLYPKKTDIAEVLCKL